MEGKANSPFAFMNAIKDERYTVPVQYICKPYIFKSDDFFIFNLNVYPLATYYPVNIIRFFSGPDDLAKVLQSCLDELYIRLPASNQQNTRKRIAIQTFKLEFLKLVALQSGEFEFIPTPFIMENGVNLRDGDDFFSRMLGYILTSTDLFQVMRPEDFADFSNSNITSTYGDYIIQGRVQLSDEMCVLYVDLKDVIDATKSIVIRYPLQDVSLKSLWNAYRDISTHIVSYIYTTQSFGIVPELFAQGRGFYANNMFVGWDSLSNFILPKGMHEISTGSYYRAEVPDRAFERPAETTTKKKAKAKKNEPDTNNQPGHETFYVLLDVLDRVYTDRGGEYAWNLLKK
jgi:hypothetical protein